MSVLSPSAVQGRRPAALSVEAVRLLDDAGFFPDDGASHELIDGALIVVPPPGAAHQRSEARVTEAFVLALAAAGLRGALRLQTGGGLRLGDDTLLQPDVMLVREHAEPRDHEARDVVLLIEIARSSLSFDLGDKAARYAAAGVTEYWVLDVEARAVIVHLDPRAGRYGAIRTVYGAAVLACAAEPRLAFPVADLF